MSPRKLSDHDRDHILELYRNTEETTSSLATRFRVSSSTVSRFLKSSLSSQEYENLIQEKRLARTSRSGEEKSTKEDSQQTKSSPVPEKTEQLQLEIETEVEQPQNSPSSPLSSEIKTSDSVSQEDNQNELSTEISPNKDTVALPEPEDIEEEEEDLESLQEVAAMFGEDMEDDEDEDEEDDEEEEIEVIEKKPVLQQQQLQVLSLDDAKFPRVCYVVIDRFSELITKPMKDFSHLGNIPPGETQQKTLPIFDNHKVAKRFCNRKGKVIKVPDGKMLQKTSNYLTAKGIKRILMDGQVYSID